jgi:hypothetical protein
MDRLLSVNLVFVCRLLKLNCRKNARSLNANGIQSSGIDTQRFEYSRPHLHGTDTGTDRMRMEGGVGEQENDIGVVMGKTAVLGQLRGAHTLAHTLDTLQQTATGKAVPGALGKLGDSAVILVGHDTNLANIAGCRTLTGS